MATVVADYDVVVDPVQLFALLREHRVNVAEPVPVVLHALLDHVSALPAQDRALPDLRCMMCTGEALASEMHVAIDTAKNRPDIHRKKQLKWDRPHGTRVEIELPDNVNLTEGA